MLGEVEFTVVHEKYGLPVASLNLRACASSSSGVVGITGERDRLPAQLREMIARLRTLTDLPLCVGFGVSTPEQVRRAMEKYAHNVDFALLGKVEGVNEKLLTSF